MPLTLVIAIVFVAAYAGFTGTAIPFVFTFPVWVRSDFSVAAMVSLALPLFIVTMASQNLPGVAAIQAAWRCWAPSAVR